MLLSACNSRACAVCTLSVVEWLVPLHSRIPQTTRLCTPQRYPFSSSHPGLGSTNRSGRKNLKRSSLPDSRHERNGSPTGPHAGSRSIRLGTAQDPHALPTSIRAANINVAKPSTKHGVFENLILEQFRAVMRDLRWYSPRQRPLLESWGLNSEEDLKQKAFNFRIAISKSFQSAEAGLISKVDNPLYHRLRSAFVGGDVRGLRREVKTAFMNAAVDLQFSEQEIANQKRIADLRYPVEWFPATRALQRTVHLHIGPTNSGKTYHALQRLEAARTGIYAGPLRLLAHEVYTRFNAKGKPCALVTGEERRYPADLKVVMNSCTVEMVPLNTKVDVAVIDEIQMIADEGRGWAWTQAFLGVQAKEVHLCGEARTMPLIKEICAELGDKLEIHQYERLSPLQTSKKHLGSLKNLQKGDAVIVFSRYGIHGMKSQIEKATGRRCAIVYGSLPPETRAQQASLFNDQDNEYDFLVASDAIGMGLNLAIKRVIFESTAKRNGAGGFEILDHSSIKQIGGRAGRYKTAHEAVQAAATDGVEEAIGLNTRMPISALKPPRKSPGYVTSIEKFDLEVVHKAMKAEVEPLKQACILPPASVIDRFASLFPSSTPFSYIILRLHELASINPRFKLCRMRDQIDTADVIQGFRLTTNDRLIFMAAPAPLRDEGLFEAVQEMAQCVAEQSGGDLLDLKSINLGLLDVDMNRYPGLLSDYLRQVETLHKIITLYLWLSYRFSGVLRSQALAFHVKSLLEDRINLCLEEVNWDEGQRQKSAKIREQMLKQKALIAQKSKPEGAEEATTALDEQDKDDIELQEPPSLADSSLGDEPSSGGPPSVDSIPTPGAAVALVIEPGPVWATPSQGRNDSATP